jgi:hypothetical protein
MPNLYGTLIPKRMTNLLLTFSSFAGRTEGRKEGRKEGNNVPFLARDAHWIK